MNNYDCVGTLEACMLVNELLLEGKKVAVLKVSGRVVSMIGYCEEADRKSVV